jgi:hypothetical protein
VVADAEEQAWGFGHGTKLGQAHTTHDCLRPVPIRGIPAPIRKVPITAAATTMHTPVLVLRAWLAVREGGVLAGWLAGWTLVSQWCRVVFF